MAAPGGNFAWAESGAARDLLAILNSEGEARFVGGCVRDSLLGMPPGPAGRTDIDIATTLVPDDTLALLRSRNIRVIPTGLTHGTVTAVIDAIPYEITTLRSDVATDGRHAEVFFTTDWEEDAGRRDFTINALYRDIEGAIYDYHDGQVDLAASRVRFIGSADARIAEDYLRILRFLRFSARYSEAMDAAGWAACLAAKAGMGRLSKERIWSELKGLFRASRAPEVIAQAAEGGLLAEIWPGPTTPDTFAAVHRAVCGHMSPSLGLATLLPNASCADVSAAFRTSRKEAGDMAAIHKGAEMLAHHIGARELIYRIGVEQAKAALALAIGRGQPVSAAVAAAITSQEHPISLPVRGRDFQDQGIPNGPGIGRAMVAFENAWIERGLPDAPEIITALTLEIAAQHKS